MSTWEVYVIVSVIDLLIFMFISIKPGVYEQSLKKRLIKVFKNCHVDQKLWAERQVKTAIVTFVEENDWESESYDIKMPDLF